MRNTSPILERIRNYQDARRVMAMGIYPYFRAIESEQGTVVTMDGKSVLMMGSNNYLGLTNHPEVKEAAKQAIDQYGTGCAGSRFLNGTLTIHTKCEEVLADFMGTESALVFSTGFMTNQGTIAPLIGRDGFIIIDRMDHASIIDAARLAFAKTIKYAHNDMEDLEKKLSSLEEKCKLIIVDGVFSMEGDIARLGEIVYLAESTERKFLWMTLTPSVCSVPGEQELRRISASRNRLLAPLVPSANRLLRSVDFSPPVKM